MLAAAVPAQAGDELLELGSGAGVASLCVATRIRECRIAGLEISPELVALAQNNAHINGMGAHVSFAHADIFDLPDGWRRSFAHVFCNPPFHGAEGKAPPREDRARALQDNGRLGDWLAAGFKRVRAGGTFTAIIRADRLKEAIDVLPTRGVLIFPLWPRANEAAKRVILQACKNSRAPLALLSGLVVHQENGDYTRDAEAVLREAGSLALGNPRR
jgi:tRNA1(Val) A37 N6-methylase TrmN6